MTEQEYRDKVIAHMAAGDEAAKNLEKTLLAMNESLKDHAKAIRKINKKVNIAAGAAAAVTTVAGFVKAGVGFK